MTKYKATGQPQAGVAFSPPPPNTDWKKERAEFEIEAARALTAFKSAIERKYQEKAQNSLNTSRDKYLAGLTFTLIEDGVDVEVNGWLPTAIEEGADAFDMKPGLLAGRFSRVIRLHNGAFRTVSQLSPPHSWWHPGIQIRFISEQVRMDTDEIKRTTVTPVIEKYMARVTI
jgi:hypothetical protein